MLIVMSNCLLCVYICMHASDIHIHSLKVCIIDRQWSGNARTRFYIYFKPEANDDGGIVRKLMSHAAVIMKS